MQQMLKRQLKPLNGLIKKFSNIYQFCNGDINKFVLLLKKVFILNNTWIAGKDLIKQKFLLKKIFTVNYIYKILLMKTICILKKVFKEFKIKNLGEYLDLYVQSDNLLLANVFENFRNKCIEIYQLDPAHFLSATGLSWQGYLKNRSKIRIINRY